jgi:serine protease inhibitor
MSKYITSILKQFSNSTVSVKADTPSEYSLLNSPYSLSAVLVPLLLGLSDETLDELAHVMGFPASQISNFARSVQSDFQKLSSSGSVDIANIMLSRDDILLRSQYLKSISDLTNHKYFEQGNHTEIIPYVNNLVKQSTHGMIDSILNEGEIDDNTFFVLLNTIYFYSDWWTKFDEDCTHPDVFSSKSGDREEQLMCLYEKSFQYHETTNHQIVLLPYQNRAFAFCIVLSKNKSDEPVRHNILDQKSPFVASVVEGSYQHLNLSIPKFTKEVELDLIPLLQGLGVTKLFDYTMQANNMVDNPPDRMALSVIRQKVKIEVNEVGTKASGATVAVCRLEGCCYREPIPTIEFKCNHPFTYYIVHMPTQNVLFSGVFE